MSCTREKQESIMSISQELAAGGHRGNVAGFWTSSWSQLSELVAEEHSNWLLFWGEGIFAVFSPLIVVEILVAAWATKAILLVLFAVVCSGDRCQLWKRGWLWHPLHGDNLCRRRCCTELDQFNVADVAYVARVPYWASILKLCRDGHSHAGDLLCIRLAAPEVIPKNAKGIHTVHFAYRFMSAVMWSDNAKMSASLVFD